MKPFPCPACGSIRTERRITVAEQGAAAGCVFKGPVLPRERVRSLTLTGTVMTGEYSTFQRFSGVAAPLLEGKTKAVADDH